MVNTILLFILIAAVLISFYYLQKLIKMSQEALTQQITAYHEQLLKAKQEIIDALASQPGVTPELQTAVDNLGVVVKDLDDLHPDTPIVIPGEGEGEGNGEGEADEQV